MKTRVVILFLILSLSQITHAEFIVSHIPSGIHAGHEDYNVDLLRLVLEKTRTEYGDYTLSATPFYEVRRRIFSLQTNKFSNLTIEIGYTDNLIDTNELTYINFPIELGLVGYRVCLVNPALKIEIAKVQTLDELRKYSIIQGVEWPDTKILRHAGFNVVEILDYDTRYKMIAGGRADLFCRGVNELKNEFDDHKNNIDLSIDDSFILAYPLPRFFYLNSKNTQAKERIEKGLKLAYSDGSLKKLLLQHYQSSIDFAKLKHRKVFHLENPDIKNLSPEYLRYVINPMKE